MSLTGGMLGGAKYGGNSKRLRELERARTALCGSAGIAEDFVLLGTMSEFYTRHEKHARLCLEYPAATVHRDSCPWAAVNLYRQTFRGQVLADSAPACIRGEGGETGHARTLRVARDHSCIVFPLASADACLTAAYAMLKCAEVFKEQCWYAPSIFYGKIF